MARSARRRLENSPSGLNRLLPKVQLIVSEANSRRFERRALAVEKGDTLSQKIDGAATKTSPSLHFTLVPK